MKTLFKKIRNLLTRTAGTPVTKPEMVTKKLPVCQSVTQTETQEKESKKKIPWKKIGSFFFKLAHYMGKLIGSAFMWSILLFIAGHFVPELRQAMPYTYHLVDFYLYCMDDLSEFIWNLIVKLSAA